MEVSQPSDLSSARSDLASRGEHLSLRAGPNWRRASFCVASAVFVHLAIGAAVLYGDALREVSSPTSEQEIPVEMIEEPPQPEAVRDVDNDEVSKSQVRESDASKPEVSKPEVSKPEVSKPEVSKPEVAKAEAEVPSPPLAESQPIQQPAKSAPLPAPPPRQALAMPPAPSEDQPAGPREPPPPPETVPKDQPSSRKTDAAERGASAATLLFLRPESFGRVAAPTAGREVNDEYKGAVFERLERFKIEPASAKARRLSGVAVVSFSLDQAGNLMTLSLVRSAGNAELDAEALALVRRAAPFPKPPPGVQLTFAPSIHFTPD